MKKVVIIVSVIIVIFIIIRYLKKIKDVVKLDIGLADFYFETKLKSLKDVAAWITDILNLTIPIWFIIAIKNFGDSKYTINNIYVQAFTVKGVKVANPVNPFTQKIIVQPKTETQFKIKYNLTVPGLIAMATEAGLKGDTKTVIATLLKKWFTTGALGLTINLKGYANAEGLKMVDIPINETQQI